MSEFKGTNMSKTPSSDPSVDPKCVVSDPRLDHTRSGEFRKLPAELRLNIWQHLMPENREEHEHPRDLHSYDVIS